MIYLIKINVEIVSDDLSHESTRFMLIKSLSSSKRHLPRRCNSEHKHKENC